ncbi:autotransporter outer membrane beta-barrel domain-containing protein, partial [Shigella flexneri]|nr:autotransporter outer membrane beta-barrel domain-containing protein [Shigella flexneri]
WWLTPLQLCCQQYYRSSPIDRLPSHHQLNGDDSVSDQLVMNGNTAGNTTVVVNSITVVLPAVLPFITN